MNNKSFELINSALDTSAQFVSTLVPETVLEGLPSVGAINASVEGAKLAKELDMGAILAASNDGLTSRQLLALRQHAALVRKCETLEGSDPERMNEEAILAFHAQQQHNVVSSIRLEAGKPSDIVGEVLARARLDLFQLLGPCPGPDDWDEFERATVMSKGTVQGLAKQKYGVDVDPYAKLFSGNTFTASRQALSVFGPILIKGPFRRYLKVLHRAGALSIGETDYSEASCVPKDALKRRFICIEPLLNLMAQHGLAAMFRGYLKKWGINLTYQGNNRKLARKASIHGLSPTGHATIDLTDASNCVITSLVEFFFPPGWERLMNAARTHGVKFGDDITRPTTYSTMGNAFTFPLQCLIFGALTRAVIAVCDCGDAQWRVYGDDIIVPCSAALLLSEVLEWCGFRVNREKSFFTGFFRESCGGDYLHGDVVVPVYSRGDLNCLTERHKIFNGIQRVESEHPVLEFLFESVPARKRYIGPDLGPYGIEDLEARANPWSLDQKIDVHHGASTSHFVAPVWYLRGLRPWVCTVAFDTDLQTYSYRWAGLFPNARNVRRSCKRRRYLAALLGSAGRTHSLRGAVSYRASSRETHTPWVSVDTALMWWYPR